MPAEITCAHCGASVAVPRDATGGVTCTFCEQRIARHVEPPVRPFPLRWLLAASVCIVGVFAFALLGRRAPPAPPGPPPPVVSPAASVASAKVSASVSAAPVRSFLRPLDAFPTHGIPDYAHHGATLLAVDGAGNVWVGDREPPHVRKHDPQGKVLLHVVPAVPADTSLTGLAVDAEESVYLAFGEPGIAIAVHGANDGKLRRHIATASAREGFRQLAVDQTGALYATTTEDTANDMLTSVVKLDRAGKVVVRFEKSANIDVMSGKPAIGGDGRVYVPHGPKRQIYVHDPTGSIVNRFGGGFGEGELGPQLGGLAWDFHGHVLVINQNLTALDAEGRYVLRSKPWNPLPVDLAIAPDGTLYVLMGDDRVQHYALDQGALPAGGEQ